MSEKTYSGIYLILSLKWSDTADHLLWWGPDNSGYTGDIDKAGRYTAEQITEKPHYYDNEDTTRAVPLYNVMEGLVGPIRRIVDAKFRYSTKSYDCGHCNIEVTYRYDPRFSTHSCYNCKKEICAACADVRECREESGGGSTTEESGP